MHSAPAKIEERPKRHTKPQLSRNGAETYRRVLAGAGRADGIEVADVVHAVTSAAGLDGEAVRDVRVLERFTLFSVPDSEADRIVEAVDGSDLAGPRAARGAGPHLKAARWSATLRPSQAFGVW